VPIRFYCSNCGQKIKAQDDMPGMKIACPTCRDRQTVPKPSGTRKSSERKDILNLKLAERFDPNDFNNSVPTGYQGPHQALAPDDLSEPLNEVVKQRTTRGSFYFLFILGLIPLVMVILSEEDESVIKRIERGIENELSGDKRSKAKKSLEAARKGQASLDDVISHFPNKKLKTAWLPRDTDMHYYIAVVAAAGFIFFICTCLPKGFSRVPILLIIGSFTGIIGTGILLIIQSISMTGWGLILAGPYAIIIFMIGIAYRLLLNPDINFVIALASYTFGVGLLEEVIKAIPIFVIFMGRSRMRWHECCAVGMATGAGFGISEGVVYSSSMYNGLAEMQMYLVRFISCVMLHAIWSASSALFLHRFQKLTHGNLTLMKALYRMLILISIPMVLHGLYDTFLTKQMEGMALAVALLSFGWLVLMVETARDKDGDILISINRNETESTPLHEQSDPPPDLRLNEHATSPSPLSGA
jgi:RsiW-degrading membrane proteinase PrsW (M82 family)/DNA-directed RNA polymerase subunit RPC12/RpoP